jgi:hypothetical protein
MAEVLRIGLSRPLRGLIALSLVSLAASLVLRGLWGGPERVGGLLDKVKFLEGIGVPKGDAALILGSTAKSVSTLESRKRGASNGRKKTKR